MEVQINLRIYAHYEKDDPPPTFRVWVDGHLYAEHDFWMRCSEFFIEECLVVILEPGEHIIKLEKIRPRNVGYIWYQKLQVMSETTDYVLEIPTKDVVISSTYLIPITINSIQENTR